MRRKKKEKEQDLNIYSEFRCKKCNTKFYICGLLFVCKICGNQKTQQQLSKDLKYE